LRCPATCSRWFLARGFFYPEDGGKTFLRNVGSHKIYTAPHPKDGILRDITYSQQISVTDLYAFVAVIGETGHDRKPSMKLCWTKDELYGVPFCSSVMPRDRFLTILKYLHFADSENLSTQDRRSRLDRLWKITQICDILNSKFLELHHPNVRNVETHGILPKIYKTFLKT
jgi:hypothetical protein